MKNKIELNVTSTQKIQFLDDRNPALISNKEFIEIFGIASSTSRSWRKVYHIPYIRNNNKIYYYLEDVLKFIDAYFVRFNQQRA